MISGMGWKQMPQSSRGGGGLKRASSSPSPRAARSVASSITGLVNIIIFPTRSAFTANQVSVALAFSGVSMRALSMTKNAGRRKLQTAALQLPQGRYHHKPPHKNHASTNFQPKQEKQSLAGVGFLAGSSGDPRPDQNLTAGLFCRSIDLKY